MLDNRAGHKRANEKEAHETYDEEEANAHHLGGTFHAVIGQSAAFNQLLGNDIAHSHQRTWKRGSKDEGERGCQSGICSAPLITVMVRLQVTMPRRPGRKELFQFLPPHSLCCIWLLSFRNLGFPELFFRKWK